MFYKIIFNTVSLLPLGLPYVSFRANTPYKFKNSPLHATYPAQRDFDNPIILFRIITMKLRQSPLISFSLQQNSFPCPRLSNTHIQCFSCYTTADVSSPYITTQTTFHDPICNTDSVLWRAEPKVLHCAQTWRVSTCLNRGLIWFTLPYKEGYLWLFGGTDCLRLQVDWMSLRWVLRKLVEMNLSVIQEMLT